MRFNYLAGFTPFNLRKRLLIIFFFSLGISPVFSQQSARLKGVVVDNNGRGLEGVTVWIEEPDSARVLVTISDSKGIFMLNRLEIKKYTIFFSLYGFEDKEEKNVEVVADYDTSVLIRMYAKGTKIKSKHDIQFQLHDW